MRNGKDPYVHVYDAYSGKNLDGKPYDLDAVRAYQDGDEEARRRSTSNNRKAARRYTRSLKKSLRAVNASRNYNRRGINDDILKKALNIFTSIAIVGAVGLPTLKHIGIFDNINDMLHGNPTMERVLDDYDIIVSQSIIGRNADNTAPQYDYRQTAQHIVDSGNIDEGLFGAYESFERRADLGDYIVLGPDGESFTDVDHSSQHASEEMDRLIKFVVSDKECSWEEYLTERGFKDENAWIHYVTEELQKRNEIKELQTELDDMYKDHQNEGNDKSTGGRSI